MNGPPLNFHHLEHQLESRMRGDRSLGPQFIRTVTETVPYFRNTYSPFYMLFQKKVLLSHDPSQSDILSRSRVYEGSIYQDSNKTDQDSIKALSRGSTRRGSAWKGSSRSQQGTQTPQRRQASGRGGDERRGVDTGGEEKRGVLTHSGQRRQRTGHTQTRGDRGQDTQRRGEASTHRHTSVGGHVVNSTRET